MRDESQRRERIERRKELLQHNLEKPPLHTGAPEDTAANRERVTMGADHWTARREMAGWLYVLLAVIIVAMGVTVALLFIGPWRAAHPVENSERVLPSPAGEPLPRAVGLDQLARAPRYDLAEV